MAIAAPVVRYLEKFPDIIDTPTFKPMIIRIWHGYTTKENADIYENLLTSEILPGIAAKNIKGYQQVQVLRRELEAETEFTTMMTFDSIDSVIEFVGEDYETVYVPESARQVLSRFDQRSAHCELRDTFIYSN